MMIKNTGFDVNFFANTGDSIRSSRKTDYARTNPADSNVPTFDSVLRGKTDTIQISSQRSSDGHSVLKDTKSDILGDISRDADPVKVQALKSSVSSGSYTVDANELAAILAE